ncbi:MAG: hypothetical protein OCC49_17755 [Fibrobacterales bacterium]
MGNCDPSHTWDYEPATCIVTESSSDGSVESSDDSSIPPGERISLPGKLEVEDYVRFSDNTPENLGGEFRNDAVDIQHTEDTGGRYNVGWVASGE